MLLLMARVTRLRKKLLMTLVRDTVENWDLAPLGDTISRLGVMGTFARCIQSYT